MKSGRKASKGTTNMELLISMSLLAIVLTCCTILFVSSFRKFRSFNTQNDVKNSAAIGISIFGRDFRETSITHIVNETETADMPGRYFCFPSPRDRSGKFQRTSTGEASFCSWIIYYVPVNRFITLDNNEKVYYLARRVVYSASLFARPDTTVASFSGDQTVAGNVSVFQVRKSVISDSLYSYDVVIETKGYNAGNIQTFKVNETFTVSNLVNFIKR